MKRFCCQLGRRVEHIRTNAARNYNTAAQVPTELGPGDVARLYEVPTAVVDQLGFAKTLPMPLQKQFDTLGELTLMCRAPLLEVGACMDAVRASFPSLRLVLWGPFGTGKSVAVHQSVHLAQSRGWVLIHHPSAMELTRKVKEVEMSNFRQGRINDPNNAVAILQLFKQQNQHVWKKLAGLTTEREYEWTKNEKTAEGRPITEIVEMGISAPFLATDCVGAFFRELKRHASNDAFKVLVAIDNANSLWGKTLVKRADRTFAKPDDLSLVRHFKDLIKGDWTNGCVLLVADKKEVSDARDELSVPRHTPLELFGEGFDAIEPFIPIESTQYSKEEVNNMYDYYVAKKWLASEKAQSQDGRLQLTHLSAFNPYYFERLCAFN